MPSSIYGHLGPFVIYEQCDIDEMLRNAKRPDFKYSLTEKGEYGHVRLSQQAQTYLLQDFTASPFFKIQHKSYADGQTETSISDPENIIKHIITSELQKHMNAGTNPDTLAAEHLTLLKQNYRGHLFATPYHLLSKIAHPLDLIVALDTTAYSPGTNNKKSTDLYYQTWPGCWVVEIKDQLKIIDPQTGISTPIQYSVKAILPTDIELKTTPINGFKLTQMTIHGNRNYINALDCFLCNNNDWDEDVIDLSELLQPLILHASQNKTINTQTITANKLKKSLTDNLRDLAFFPNEIATLKQPGPLKDIVWNLGFLIAIKCPDLYRALGIGRNVYPPMPDLSKGYTRIETLGEKKR